MIAISFLHHVACNDQKVPEDVVATVVDDSYSNHNTSRSLSPFATKCKQRLQEKKRWKIGRWHFPSETESLESSMEWRVVWPNKQAGCSVAAARNGLARFEVGAPPRQFRWNGEDVFCEAVTEWDFLFDVILKDVQPPISELSVIAPSPFLSDDKTTIRTVEDTLGVLVERGIYIVSVSLQSNLTMRAQVRELGEALAICGATSSVLIHLADEHASLDSFYEPWPLVLRQYFSPALARRWSQKLLFIPLGYASGFQRALGNTQQPRCETNQETFSTDLLPSSQRRWAWAFVGDIGTGKKLTRWSFYSTFTRPNSPLGEVVDSIASDGVSGEGKSRSPRGGFCHVTDRTTGWPDQWSYTYTMRPAGHIAAAMVNATFCPAPLGFTSMESYRFWEAIEAGCLPIIDAVETNLGETPAFMIPAFEPSRMNDNDDIYFQDEDDTLNYGLSSFYYEHQESTVVHHPQYFRYFLSYASNAYDIVDGNLGLKSVPRFFFEVDRSDWKVASQWMANQLDMINNEDIKPAVKQGAGAECHLDRRQRAMIRWWAQFKTGIARTVANRLAEINSYHRCSHHET